MLTNIHNTFSKPLFNAQRVIKKKYDIDCDIAELSSRKLWRVLQLSEIKGCELDKSFLEEVKSELIIRNDFDEGRPWAEPH